jgi:hypothetical protein
MIPGSQTMGPIVCGLVKLGGRPCASPMGIDDAVLCPLMCMLMSGPSCTTSTCLGVTLTAIPQRWGLRSAQATSELVVPQPPLAVAGCVAAGPNLRCGLLACPAEEWWPDGLEDWHQKAVCYHCQRCQVLAIAAAAVSASVQRAGGINGVVAILAIMCYCHCFLLKCRVSRL